MSVTAAEAIELSGTTPDGQSKSGLFATSRGTGDAGDLIIDTGQLTVREQAQASVSNLGTGSAGNLQVQADSIRLDEGKLAAETASGRGGNISLQAQDLLLLRNQSQISTTAGTVGAGGNGGNIEIDADFLIGLGNSDITANSFEGEGGFIQITATEGVFGLERRDILTGDSDITAFSQRAPALSGEIAINNPDVDPTQGLVELPAE